MRPFVGIAFIDMSPAIVARYGFSVNEGALVTTVQKDTPAEKAGLRRGDVIVTFAGERTPRAERLRLATQRHGVGETVEAVYVRGTTTYRTQLTLAESPIL